MDLILAETAAQGGIDSGLLGGLLGAAGGVGFAVWYGYYITTTTMPKLVADFREERKIDREERKQEREEFTVAIEKLSDAVSKIPCRLVSMLLVSMLLASTASAADWFNPVDDPTFRHPPQIPRQRICHRQPVMRFVGYQRRFVLYADGFWRLEWCEVWERSDVTVCR